MTRLYAAVALAGAAALLGTMGYLVLTREAGDPFAPCRSAQVAGGAGALGGPFVLTAPDGRRVTEADLAAAPAILYFGYTFCPDVCPFDTARNAAAVDLLEARGIAVTPVFITVDPARDTPEVMGEFAAYIHPRMLALTGSEAEVRAAAQAYRVYFRAHEGDPATYLVDHSTFSYLVLPGHGVVEVFRRETTPEDMAEAVACFVGRAGGA
jgi:protein SCO1/2